MIPELGKDVKGNFKEGKLELHGVRLSKKKAAEKFNMRFRK